MCAPSPVATSPGGTRQGGGGTRPTRCLAPRPAGGVGRYGRSPGFRIFLLPGLPTRATPLGGSTSRSGTSPVSYPVTVAGAAPESHRLPFRRRRASSHGGRDVTAPSVLSKKSL